MSETLLSRSTYTSQTRRLNGHGLLRRASDRLSFLRGVDLLLHLVEVRQQHRVTSRNKAHVPEGIREVLTSFARISVEKVREGEQERRSDLT